MSKKKRLCVLCGRELLKGDFGNNPEPLKPFSEGVCCDDCNRTKVIPARIKAVVKAMSEDRKQEVKDDSTL